MKEAPEEPLDDAAQAARQEELQEQLLELEREERRLGERNATVWAAFENYKLPRDRPLFKRLTQLQKARRFYIPGLARSGRECGRRLWDASQGLMGEPPPTEER